MKKRGNRDEPAVTGNNSIIRNLLSRHYDSMPIFYTPSYLTMRMASLCQRRATTLENHLHGVARSTPCKIFLWIYFFFDSGALCILRQEELYSPGPEASLWKSLLIDVLLPDSPTKYSRAEILGLIMPREGERYLLLLTSASPRRSQYSTESQPSGSMNQEGIQGIARYRALHSY